MAVRISVEKYGRNLPNSGGHEGEGENRYRIWTLGRKGEPRKKKGENKPLDQNDSAFTGVS